MAIFPFFRFASTKPRIWVISSATPKLLETGIWELDAAGTFASALWACPAVLNVN